MQMVLTPNDLFSWNSKIQWIQGISLHLMGLSHPFPAMHATHSVHAGSFEPWRGRLPCLLAVFSFHSLSLPGESSPPFSKMASSLTGSAHPPLPGCETPTISRISVSAHQHVNIRCGLGSDPVQTVIVNMFFYSLIVRSSWMRHGRKRFFLYNLSPRRRVGNLDLYPV